MLAVHLLVVRSPYLVATTAIVLAAALLMIGSLHKVSRGDAAGAVRWLAVANWGAALAASAIATFAWPLMTVAALVPAPLVAPYVTRRRVAGYIVASVGVSLGVVALGVLQDFSGLSSQLPLWLRHSVVIGFTPFLSAMVAMLAFQSSGHLQGLLAELADSRARIAAAADGERRRIERDIHDGAQQRLTALAIRLGQARQRCVADPQSAAAMLDEARQELRLALAELRDLAHGIYPAVLTNDGLTAALHGVARRAPVPVKVAGTGVGRLAAEVEAAVYFCCVEALQNATTHAGPGAGVGLRLWPVPGDGLAFEIADDGRGIGRGSNNGGPTVGRGLDNMRDRLEAVGGQLTITSAPGGGTVVRGVVRSAGRYGQPYPPARRERSGHQAGGEPPPFSQ
jgi:signal transduction histidine kinase